MDLRKTAQEIIDLYEIKEAVAEEINYWRTRFLDEQKITGKARYYFLYTPSCDLMKDTVEKTLENIKKHSQDAS